MKENENASLHGCYMTLCPCLRLSRKLKEYVWAYKIDSMRQSWSAWCILRQKALWVALGNGDGRSRGTMYRKELVPKIGTRLS